MTINFTNKVTPLQFLLKFKTVSYFSFLIVKSIFGGLTHVYLSAKCQQVIGSCWHFTA